jgi:hypothetical protein
MQDNVSRGNRTVLWSKIVFVFSLVVAVLAMSCYNLMQSSVASEPADFLFSDLILLLGTVLVGMALMVSVSMQGLFWLLWMFRAEQNLRKITHTTFSPWAAVICCCLPYLGQLIHYFVLRDLIKHTENELTVREAKTEKVPMSFVKAYLVLTILSGVFSFAGESIVSLGGCMVFALASLACFIRVISTLVTEEQALYQLYQEEVLRAKVDQVLRERELEAAASKVAEPVEPPKDLP